MADLRRWRDTGHLRKAAATAAARTPGDWADLERDLINAGASEEEIRAGALALLAVARKGDGGE